MNQRIQLLICELGIKKAEFARRLNISQPFVSELCSGAKSPSKRTIADICKKFNVSESWILNGEGDMFKQIDKDTDLQRIFAEITLSEDELIKRFIKAYWQMDEDEKRAIRKLADALIPKHISREVRI